VFRTRLYFFLLVAFAVALGIQFMGVLLMGALIILPGAVAKNVSPNLRVMIVLSVVLGICAAVVGTYASAHLNILPGPAVVIILVVLFAISLLFRGRYGASRESMNRS